MIINIILYLVIGYLLSLLLKREIDYKTSCTILYILLWPIYLIIFVVGIIHYFSKLLRKGK